MKCGLVYNIVVKNISILKIVLWVFWLTGLIYLGFYIKSNYFIRFAKEVSSAYLPVPGLTKGPIISLNFDDGYESAYKVGMPIIEKAGFKSSHYIIVNRIGEQGYMSRKQILDLQASGHEVGAHSITHTNLVLASTKVAREEIFDSKKELEKRGVLKVSTFTYPDGYFDQGIANIVKEAGYAGARITNPGLNDKNIDPYKLLYLGMNSEITFETVTKKIDEAILQKKWLIMVFHKIDESGFENVSSELLQKIIDYLKKKDVPIVTTVQGLFILKNI